METNAMATGLYSSMGSGMLGLEMSLQHHHHHQLPPPQPNNQNPHLHHHMQQQQQHQAAPPPQAMVGYGLPDPQPLVSVKPAGNYPFAAKPKNQTLTLSDEDDQPGAGTENSGEIDGKKKMTSPWQRMKWTDNMVRVLIMVVYCIGDEGGGGGGEGNSDPVGKKKGSGSGSGSGVALQKKGKWKSVSRAMMERGFYVSPQQCEDKFNDLNKRYKRVNDILGKGISCKVVENQSLLDSMDHLSPKTKEEVKKLLNSKHLFFREMCAYHNSCGHGGGGGGGGAGNGGAQAQQLQSPEAGAEQRQICLHSPAIGGRGKEAAEEEEEEEEEDEDDEEEEEEDEEEDDHVHVHPMAIARVGGRHHYDDHGHDTDDDTKTIDERCSRKRQRGFVSGLIQQLSGELESVFQDERRNLMEKRRWMRRRLVQLEEEHVGYQSQAFELEKQRLKWMKFSSKKEREMERDKLNNERMILENERMVLLIRHKELESLDQLQQHHHSSRMPDPSSITG